MGSLPVPQLPVSLRGNRLIEHPETRQIPCIAPRFVVAEEMFQSADHLWRMVPVGLPNVVQPHNAEHITKAEYDSFDGPGRFEQRWQADANKAKS